MIYIFFAPGFEEIEAIATLDVLRRAGLEIQSVGIGEKYITGSHDITITCDVIDSEITTDNLEMIILPGGIPGAKNLEASPVVQSTVRYAAEHGLYIAAICAAPVILGRMGLLNGKRCTCYPGYEAELGKGSIPTGERAVCDGNIVTGKGAGSTLQFALKLVACLRGDSQAHELEKKME